MAHNNQDLQTWLSRAAGKYNPEMYTPSGAELEHGLGEEPLVRLTLKDGQVVAMCRLIDDGATILCDVYTVAEEGAEFPFSDGEPAREEGLHGELPKIGSLVEKIEAAADSLIERA